ETKKVVTSVVSWFRTTGGRHAHSWTAARAALQRERNQCSMGGSSRRSRVQRLAQPFERKRSVVVPKKSQNKLRRTEMKASFAVLFTIIAAALPHLAFGQGVRASSLRAGAAKVDVTPAERDLPKNYDGILERLYSRAIVLESGNTNAALITVDAGGVPDQVWQNVTQQIQKDLG